MPARPSRMMLRSLIIFSMGAALWTSPAISAVKPVTAKDPRSQWLGKWIGPEGTYLQLSRQANAYRIEIQSLDGQRRFTGKPLGKQRIQFQRDGKTLQIREGKGRDTGMKWLATKENCLIIESGEGYCR
jgi:hypothetical protein